MFVFKQDAESHYSLFCLSLVYCQYLNTEAKIHLLACSVNPGNCDSFCKSQLNITQIMGHWNQTLCMGVCVREKEVGGEGEMLTVYGIQVYQPNWNGNSAELLFERQDPITLELLWANNRRMNLACK